MNNDDELPAALQDALSDKSMLGTYQDEPVLKTTIKLTKAGDGLSKSMKISPSLLPVGSKVMVLVECEVSQHLHKRITDTEAFELVQTLEAATVTIVDDRSSARKIERQRRALDKAQMKAKGVERLSDQEGNELEVDNDLDGDDGDDLDGDEGSE